MVILQQNLARIALMLFAATAVLGFATPTFADTKSAVVDVKRAITETEEGLRARSTLKKFFEKRQTELSGAEQGLQKEREKLEKDRPTLKREQYETRLEKFQRDAMKLQQQLMQYQQELAKKEAELFERIQKGVMAIIRRIATKEGYDLVVDRGAVAYARSDLDITDKVITSYNKQNASKK